MEYVIFFIQILFRSAVFLLLLHVILSMFVPGDSSIRIGIAKIVEPFLAPFRKLVKPFNGIDFSPVLAMVAINLIEVLITSLLRRLVQ